MADYISDEERRRIAQSNMWTALGFGLLGAPKGQEMQALGRAGLLGLAARNQSYRDTDEARVEALRARKYQMELDAYQAAQGQQQALAQANEQAQRASFVPPQPAMSMFGQPMPPDEPSAPFSAQPGGFDPALYAKNLTANPMTLEKGLALQQTLGKSAKKLKDTRTMMKDGQRVTVNLYDDGTHEILPYAPDAEKLHFANVGNAIIPADPFTGKPAGGALPVSQSPDSAASVGATLRGQNMTDARAREGLAQQAAAGQIVETPQGYARIGKDNTVTPILAGDGQLQAKPTGAVQQQIATNQVTLSKIDQAEKAVTAYPGAFGLQNVFGDQAMQRLDPKGVTARALIADIAGQKIHDRSGAAVTVGEAERLKPYVPNVNDRPETIRKKLSLFRKEYEAMQRELLGGASISQVTGGGGSSGTIKFSQLPPG